MREKSDVNILIVDDREADRIMICDTLKLIGYDVDTAHDGEQALEKYISTKYDIIFMDIEMPNMDGFGATEAIRKREKMGGHTPIVGVSAIILSQQDRRNCIIKGMDNSIAKPVKKEVLELMLETYLDMS